MSSDNTKDNNSTSNDNNNTRPLLPATPPSPVSTSNVSPVSTSSQTTKFSRSVLKGIPEEGKKKLIQLIIQGFINDLQIAASYSKTSYTYVIDDQLPHNINQYDLIAAFLVEFDGCAISYRETTISNPAGKRSIVKSIVIDWS